MKTRPGKHEITNVDRRQFIGKSSATAAGLGLLTLGTHSVKTLAQQADERRPPAPPPGMGAPTYTLAERDRRFAAVRALLERNNLDALMVPQRTGTTILQFANYLTNEGAFLKPSVVILPVSGDPFTMNARPFPSAAPRWITRSYSNMQGRTGELVVRSVREEGLADRRFGVVGLEPGQFGLPEFFHDGLWDHSTWNEIETGLPDASFVDITDQFTELMMVKGDEEVANVRKAAAAGERLHEFMLATAREGMEVRELRAEIHKFFVLNDIVSDIQVHAGGGPMRAGQRFATEYGIHHAGSYAQVTLTFTIGEPSEAVLGSAEIARRVLDHGLDNVRPGRTFASVIDPMEQIVADAGLRHGFPHIHSLMPLALVGPVGQGGPYQATRGADIVLQPGMALSFECGAFGSRSDEVRLGGTGVVTENGFEMFNTLGLELHSV